MQKFHLKPFTEYQQRQYDINFLWKGAPDPLYFIAINHISDGGVTWTRTSKGGSQYFGNVNHMRQQSRWFSSLKVTTSPYSFMNHEPAKIYDKLQFVSWFNSRQCSFNWMRIICFHQLATTSNLRGSCNILQSTHSSETIPWNESLDLVATFWVSCNILQSTNSSKTIPWNESLDLVATMTWVIVLSSIQLKLLNVLLATTPPSQLYRATEDSKVLQKYGLLFSKRVSFWLRKGMVLWVPDFGLYIQGPGSLEPGGGPKIKL